ncbi:MAG: hypothetical protein CL916_00500 [Deltaproteobacteria bacterium]|nr:hypothetical protein [Deltaproteobacteria bacterium]
MERKQVHVVIRQQKAEVERLEKRKKKIRKWTLGIIVPLMLYIFLVSADLTCFGIGLGILGFIIWNVAGMRANSKGDFLMKFLHELQHDIKINSKVHYHLDETPYASAEKKTWEGRSMHGNYKYKATDHWLAFNFICTDGTKVKLDFITKYKVRKGYVMKQKFIIKMLICPNHHFYALDSHDTLLFCKKMITNHLSEHFDEPIQTWVHPNSTDEGMHFRIKILQEDEAYTVDQVVGFLRPIFGHFSHHTRTAG